MILLPVFTSWLWRLAGRGGFPEALWLRRAVVPYLVFLVTGNPLTAVFLSAVTFLPITLIGSGLKDNYWWLYVLGGLYGLAMTLFSFNWGLNFILLTAASSFLHGFGLMAVDRFQRLKNKDFYFICEYFWGAWIGLLCILS